MSRPRLQRQRARSRGVSYVEVLVIVGVVLLLGVVAVTALGRSSSDHASREAECIKTFSCGGGSGGASDVSSLTAKGPNAPEGKGFWGTTGDIAAGFFVDGLWGTVKGVGTAIIHPVDTVTNIGSAIAHPINTATAIKDNVVAAWNENPERLIGSGLFEVVTLPIAATKGAKAAKAASIVEEGADAAKAAEKLADAGDAAKLAKSAEGCASGICTNGSCFGAGTPVATPEGDRPIETLVEGDLVLARDPVTGATEPHRIAEVIVTQHREVLDLGLEHADGSVEMLVVTPEHPFFREGVGFVSVASLNPGDAIVTVDGVARVRSLASKPDLITVYNFEVEVAHTYFVGKTSAWVHNTCVAQMAQERLNKLTPAQAKATFENAFEKVHGRKPTDAESRAAATGALDPKVKQQMLDDLAGGATPASGQVGLDRVGEQKRLDEIAQRNGGIDTATTGANSTKLPSTGKVLGRDDVVNVDSYDRVASAIDGQVTVASKRVSLDKIEEYVDTLRGGGSVPPVEVAAGNPPIIVSGYESYVAGQMTGKTVEIKTVSTAAKGTTPSTIPVD